MAVSEQGGERRNDEWRGCSYRQSRGGGGGTQARSHCSQERGPPPPWVSCCCALAAQLSVEVGVEVVLLAELVRERDAGEQLAPLALDRVDVEEHDEPRKEPQEHHQEDDDLTALAVQVHAAEADVRQEGERQEEAGDEAGDVGKIVDPGQQTEGKEEEHHAQQLGEGPPGLGEDLPALKQLHKQAGENPELRASWTHLRGTEGHTFSSNHSVSSQVTGTGPLKVPGGWRLTSAL